MPNCGNCGLHVEDWPPLYMRHSERCECHACTQARYRQSLQYQFDQFYGTHPLQDRTHLPKENNAE